MKVLTIASAKGGSGKSTLAGALAVRLCQESPRAAMIDLNYDQGSLTDWHALRRKAGLSPLPHIDADAGASLEERIAALGRDYDWAFIDTPPMDLPLIEDAIALADFVLAPTRCGFFDMAAANTIVSMCRRHATAFGFVINCADAKHAIVLKQTVTAIRGLEWPLLAAQVKYRQAWIQALSVGKTGAEINRDARFEIDELWAEIQKHFA